MHETYYKNFDYRNYEVEICWELSHDNFSFYIKWNGSILYVETRFEEPDDAENEAKRIVDLMIEKPYNWKELI